MVKFLTGTLDTYVRVIEVSNGLAFREFFGDRVVGQLFVWYKSLVIFVKRFFGFSCLVGSGYFKQGNWGIVVVFRVVFRFFQFSMFVFQVVVRGDLGIYVYWCDVNLVFGRILFFSLIIFQVGGGKVRGLRGRSGNLCRVSYFLKLCLIGDQFSLQTQSVDFVSGFDRQRTVIRKLLIL